MSSASKLNINLILSRILSLDEINQFNSINDIETKDYTLIGNQIVSVDGTEFEYTNFWRVNSHSNLYLFINEAEDQHFFIESLICLIENFFEPKDIKLNGFIKGYDDIFGNYFSYIISNNKIYLEYEKYKNIYTCDIDEDMDNLIEDFNFLN
jgi:hypothetical protein